MLAPRRDRDTNVRFGGSLWVPTLPSAIDTPTYILIRDLIGCGDACTGKADVVVLGASAPNPRWLSLGNGSKSPRNAPIPAQIAVGEGGGLSS